MYCNIVKHHFSQNERNFRYQLIEPINNGKGTHTLNITYLLALVNNIMKEKKDTQWS